MSNLYLLNKLKGIQTIESVMDSLRISKNKAILQIHNLRKAGYVKTKRLSNNKRVYSISEDNKLKGAIYEEIINKYSPINVTIPKNYYVYRKKLTLEETLIYAIKTHNIRTILASLGLFKSISNWKLLYHLAKENHLERQVGALYDMARTIIRTRKMGGFFLKNSLPKKNYDFRYLIPKLKSKEFKDIEKKWRIYLPFNEKDLEDYK